MPEGSVDGLILLDKPAGWTSHDAVAHCRRVFRQKKVGHAGTLDPDATGLLLVGLGRATRLLQFLVGLAKSYSAEVVLGTATTTLDTSGEVTGRWDMSHVTLAEARAAATTLTGTITQIPPMVSAVQVGGRRLHQLARAGVEVDRPPRTVTVSRFDLTMLAHAERPYGPVLAIEVDCGSGTYIRSLAADLGAALGGGAHLRNLRRTAVGPWTVAGAVALEQVSMEQVLPPAAAVRGLPAASVAADLIPAVSHGKVLDRAELGVDGDGPWAVLDGSGELLAVYQAHHGGRVKPTVVVALEPAPPGPSGAR